MSEAGSGWRGAVEVPPEVRDAVDGVPELDTLEPVLTLLTVDSEGRVDVCLLSRTEVEATQRSVRLVVAGRKARRNLRATGRATVVVVADDAAHYLALRARRVIEEDDAMAAELEVERYLRDGLDVELHPMRFLVDGRLVVEERWDQTRRLLARLAIHE